MHEDNIYYFSFIRFYCNNRICYLPRQNCFFCVQHRKNKSQGDLYLRSFRRVFMDRGRRTLFNYGFSQYTAAFKGNILVFLAASIVLGSFIIFYYFVKGVYIYEDRIVYVSIVGKKTEVLWEEIIDIKITQMQRVKLFYGPNSSITVGGEKKDFKEFLRFAIRLLPESVDKNQLIAIGTRYKI